MAPRLARPEGKRAGRGAPAHVRGPQLGEFVLEHARAALDGALGGARRGESRLAARAPRRAPPVFAHVAAKGGLASPVDGFIKRALEVAERAAPGHQQRQDARQKQQAEEREQRIRELVEEGERHERAMDPPSALTCYQEAVRLDPSRVQNIVLESKAMSDLSLDPQMGWEEARELVAKAADLSRDAQRIDPQYGRAHLAEAINMGRLAAYSGNKEKAQYASLVLEKGKLAVKLDPNDDLAHHALGRWYHEMAAVNAIVRTLVRWVYGERLEAGSYKLALAHYERAYQLAPHKLVHQVEVGRTLLRMGDRRRALVELEEALGKDVTDVNDRITKQWALSLLDDLRMERPIRWGCPGDGKASEELAREGGEGGSSQ